MKTTEEKRGQAHWPSRSLHKWLTGAIFTVCLTVPATLALACPTGTQAGDSCKAQYPDDPTLCQDCVDGMCSNARCTPTTYKQCIEGGYLICVA